VSFIDRIIMLKTGRKIIYLFIFYTGLIYLFRFVYRLIFKNPIRIIYTHHIIDKADKDYEFLKCIDFFDTQEFIKKIKYLKKHYTFISLEDAVELLKHKKRLANRIVLTFDDGYRSVYERAFPILKKYNVPAVVFLTVDFLENKRISWFDKLILLISRTEEQEFKTDKISAKKFRLGTKKEKKRTFLEINKYLKTIPDDEKDAILNELEQRLGGKTCRSQNKENLMLNWEQIDKMRASGLISFGAHTRTHPILSNISLDRAEREILTSKRIIENRLNVPVKFFAYPGGCLNPAIKKIVRASGYLAALTTRSGGNNHDLDFFALNRDGFVKEPLFMFALQESGFFDLFKKRVFIKKNVDAGYYDKSKGFRSWLPAYLKQAIFLPQKILSKKPVHIMLMIADHFEPFHGGVSLKKAQERVDKWVKKYPEFAVQFKDADGKHPQHTWFYPPHLEHCFLKDIVGLCKQGYGEIEMHLHHNHMEPFPDTSETLKQKILKCIEDYSKHGIFCQPDGSRRFAFVHGDWSLDNACGPEICGVNDEIRIVNDEIRILKECGCFADFTFPSLGNAQPAMINKIYYAKDNPNKPKSYNKGKELIAGGKPWGDLLLIPGIIGLRWRSRTHRFRPSIETSNLDINDKPFPKRIDYLIKNAITIKGRPNWKFIKLHTHGAVESAWDGLMGESALLMHQYLKENYNDGKKFVLHYITAREMFNIIKAAEAGKKDNPNDYRGYTISKYNYLDK